MTGYHNSNSYLEGSGFSSSKKALLVVAMGGLWTAAAVVIGLALFFFELASYSSPPSLGQ